MNKTKSANNQICKRKHNGFSFVACRKKMNFSYLGFTILKNTKD